MLRTFQVEEIANWTKCCSDIGSEQHENKNEPGNLKQENIIKDQNGKSVEMLNLEVKTLNMSL